MNEEVAEIPAPAPLNLVMLLLAGAGSLNAQRDARDAALQVAGTEEAPLEQALTAAELMGWMAARSGEAADFRALAVILLRRGDELAPTINLRLTAFAQAISLLDLAVEAGDHEAIDMLADAMNRAPEDTLSRAKIFNEEWRETIAELNSMIEEAAAHG